MGSLEEAMNSQGDHAVCEVQAGAQWLGELSIGPFPWVYRLLVMPPSGVLKQSRMLQSRHQQPEIVYLLFQSLCGNLNRLFTPGGFGDFSMQNEGIGWQLPWLQGDVQFTHISQGVGSARLFRCPLPIVQFTVCLLVLCVGYLSVSWDMCITSYHPSPRHDTNSLLECRRPLTIVNCFKLFFCKYFKILLL